MPITFLEVEDVIDIHCDLILRYGGSNGIRDRKLLESAIGVPQATFDELFLHHDIFEMAAAYLFHLTSNHPFVDGNKRVGAAAAFKFLFINGLEVVATEEDFEAIAMRAATGSCTKEEIAQFFRTNTEHIG